MAYMVATLRNVPVGEFEYFLVVLETDPTHDYSTWFDAHLSAVGHELGREGAVVRGHDAALTLELFEQVSRDLSEDDAHSFERLLFSGPCLLISKGHPFRTTEPLILIPLPSEGEGEGKANEYLTALIHNLLQALHGGTLLPLIRQSGYQELELRGRKIEMWLTRLERVNQVLELRPGVPGFNVNLNKLIESFIERYRAGHSAR